MGFTRVNPMAARCQERAFCIPNCNIEEDLRRICVGCGQRADPAANPPAAAVLWGSMGAGHMISLNCARTHFV